MSHNTPRSKIIYHLDNIDGTAVGANEVIVLPYQKFYPSETIIECMASNALSSVPTISLGASPTYDNILTSRELTGLLNANNMVHVFGAQCAMQPGARICLNITKPATGGQGLLYQIRLVLIGVLI